MQSRRENLRKARISLEHQLERLTEAYLSGAIALPEYQRRRGELQQRQQMIEQQTEQLQAQADQRVKMSGLIDSVEAFCRRVKAGLAESSFEQKRQLVELLIDRVVVTDDQVEIRYVIPTSPKSVNIRFCQLRSDYFHYPSARFASATLALALLLSVSLIRYMYFIPSRFPLLLYWLSTIAFVQT
jgi:site-specific DNA recombinase